MKTIHTFIELLIRIETAIIRRKAASKATRAAVRMAMNGCRM